MRDTTRYVPSCRSLNTVSEREKQVVCGRRLISQTFRELGWKKRVVPHIIAFADYMDRVVLK